MFRRILIVLSTMVSLFFLSASSQAALRDKVQNSVKQFVKDFLQEKGIEVDWSAIRFQFQPQGLELMTVTIKAKRLQIDIPDVGIKANISDLLVGLQLKMGLDRIQLVHVGPVAIKGGNVDLKLKKKSSQKEPFLEIPSLPALALSETLAKTTLGAIDVDLRELVIRDGKKTLATLSLDLSNREKLSDRLLFKLKLWKEK